LRLLVKLRGAMHQKTIRVKNAKLPEHIMSNFELLNMLLMGTNYYLVIILKL